MRSKYKLDISISRQTIKMVMLFWYRNIAINVQFLLYTGTDLQ